MSLETLFITEENFSNLNVIPHVRRDPELGGQQLYLADDVTNQKKGKLCLQALGDNANSQISCFTFLKHQFNSNATFEGLPGCAIDERERLLYVLIGGGVKDVCLKLFHLRYQTADKFGYRPIIVEEGCRVDLDHQLLCGRLSPIPLTAPPYAHTLSICPSTGQLVTGQLQVAIIPADLVYDQKQQKGKLKALTDRLPLMTALQTSEMELRSKIFSRSNHELLWLNYRRRNWSELHDGTVRPVDDCSTVLRAFVPGRPTNGHLNEIKIHPVQLVQQ